MIKYECDGCSWKCKIITKARKDEDMLPERCPWKWEGLIKDSPEMKKDNWKQI